MPIRHFVAVLACFLAFLPEIVTAQSALKALETSDEGRRWDAVGRIDLDGRGFCTGALIAPNLVLTAAHCLFDKESGARLDLTKITFMAGWRNGRAEAYRSVARAVMHPDYRFTSATSLDRVRFDIALMELHHPIEQGRALPFQTDMEPRTGDRIGVVSYAKGRSEAPSLQSVCGVLNKQDGVLIMSCDVNFGASGAPIFSFASGYPKVVSVVSAMAETGGQKVSLGTELKTQLPILRAALARGEGVQQAPAPRMSSIGERRSTGAKFARP